MGKYEILTAELKAHFAKRTIQSITVDDLREVQATWKVKPITACKRIERLRRFFRFCTDSDWMTKNPAKVLDLPIVAEEQVVPFSPEEWDAILKATENYPDVAGRPRVRAFVLVLRYCGLRIGDAVTLRRDKIRNGKLILRTTKRGVNVFMPIKREVLDALAVVQNDNPAYFFWSGNGKRKSGIGRWQDKLQTLFKLAKVTGGHAHRFRHSFAVDLLSRGVSLENVAKAMGNTPAIAHKHYSAWVPQRQAALEAEFSKAWGASA